MRVVKHWHKLPKEQVGVPILEVFLIELDGQPDLVKDIASHPKLGWIRWLLKVPSNPR